jgi:hypothetical protein
MAEENSMDKRTSKLVEVLGKRTVSGKLVWEKTGRETEFSTEIEGKKITVDKWKTEEQDDLIDFCMYNENGEQILYHQYPLAGRNPSSALLLEELYEIIKKKYYKVDETIDEIFKALGESPPPTDPEDDIPF